MGTWQDLHNLLEMYSSGGLTIATGMDGVEMETAVSDTNTYNGKIHDQTGIRTTIQLDSDYVTILSPSVLQHPKLWQQHMTQVNAKLAVLDKLQAWVQNSWVLFLLFPLAWFWSSLLQVNSIQDVWTLVYPTLLSGVIVLVRKYIPRVLLRMFLPIVMRLVRWYAKRQFDEVVGS